MRLGIIGGSGSAVLRPPEAVVLPGTASDTPFGPPSGPLWRWVRGRGEFLLQHRHGEAHSLLPHEVNYRANIWQLHRAGVERVIGANTVGQIDPGIAVGDLVLPDQLVDYTWGRTASFGGVGGFPAGGPHIDFTSPFDTELRDILRAAATAAGVQLTAVGTYGVTQGPRLETAAEIARLARDGCTIVGMTAMPEAALAREAGLAYALLCVAVNPAAGLGPPGASIHARMAEAAGVGLAQVQLILAALADGPGG